MYYKRKHDVFPKGIVNKYPLFTYVMQLKY